MHYYNSFVSYTFLSFLPVYHKKVDLQTTLVPGGSEFMLNSKSTRQNMSKHARPFKAFHEGRDIFLVEHPPSSPSGGYTIKVMNNGNFSLLRRRRLDGVA